MLTTLNDAPISWDLINIFGLLSIAAIVAVAYMIRVAMKGRPQFPRVDNQGGSSLLSKEMMEGAYWFFQPLARMLIMLHVTPNMISWMSLLLGALAGACLAVGHFGFGAAFATLSAVLDSLDGIVARETAVSSDAGEVLDATVDRYTEFFFLAGLVVYYREIPALIVLTLFALVGSFMVSYSSAKAEALQVDPPKGNMRRPERALYLILGATLSPITIPLTEQIRQTPIPVAYPMVVALVLVAVLANISAVERLYAIAKAVRLRERRALQEARESALAAAGECEDEAAERQHPVR